MLKSMKKEEWDNMIIDFLDNLMEDGIEILESNNYIFVSNNDELVMSYDIEKEVIYIR